MYAARIHLVVTGLLIVGFCLAGEAATGKPAIQKRAAAMLFVFTQVLGEEKKNPDDHLDETFGTVKRAGFDVAQGWLHHFATTETAVATKALLDKHKLTMVGVYSGGKLHDDGAALVISGIVDKAKIAKNHGVQFVVLNPAVADGGREKTDDELATQARNLDQLGTQLDAQGLRLAVHTHDKEMRSGAREWYHILKNTNPKKVFFCMDVHWLYRGAADPYTLIKDAGPRIIDLHLRNSKDGTWMEDFGPGDIDYTKVESLLKAAKFKGTYTVELAYEKKTPRTRSLEENLRQSRAYLRAIFKN